MIVVRRLFYLALLILLLPPGLPAQQDDSLTPLAREPARVMILGTYHMSNPGSDVVNVRADDVTSPERQAELETLADRLAAFQPDAIAVEMPPSRTDSLARWYEAYRAGASLPIPTSELDQVSFRLAQRLGLEGVHGVDRRMDLGIEGVMEYAVSHGMADRPRLAQRASRQVAAEMQRIQSEGTVIDVLAYLNSPAVAETHGFYLVLAPVGEGTDYPGAEMAASWYERNLKIFANIWRLAEPGKRILVVIGAGHGTLLRRFVEDSPELELVPALPYLRGESERHIPG